MKRYETISEATRAWVSEFNRFPTDMISVLMAAGEPDEWMEVTPPAIGDRVYIDDDITPDESDSDQGEIIDYDPEGGIYTIKTDDGVTFVTESSSSFYVDRYDLLPMWGSMWQFGDFIDDEWIEEDGGLQALADCGFRVYHHEEWGYFFGIDGAGYDFFSAHWERLYKKRGLNWHEYVHNDNEQEGSE